MNIDIKSQYPTLWYENDAGDIFIPDFNGGGMIDPPDGFIYQHSQFPLSLEHNVLRDVVPSEVKECNHERKYIKRTFGWIDGVEGRECMKCHGTQMRKVGERWPTKWSAYGSRGFMSGSCTYSGDLALAMSSPKFKWWVKAFLRGFILPKYELGEAILIAANACERCMNTLAYQYGLDWGYKEWSADWVKTNTKCKFCEHMELESAIDINETTESVSKFVSL